MKFQYRVYWLKKKVERPRRVRPSLLLFSLILPVFVVNHAIAGTGWYVTIVNQSNADLTIQPAGNDSWYCNDFCGSSTLEAGQSHRYYTEDKGGNHLNYGIQGIDLVGSNNQKVHLEFVMGNHPYSGSHVDTTTVYGHGASAVECQDLADAHIYASDPSMISVTTFSAGDINFCDGFYGTVSVILYFPPRNSSR